MKIELENFNVFDFELSADDIHEALILIKVYSLVTETRRSSSGSQR
ncbi:hypothetical protein [Leeuwenhoekiella sp. ZYFB001]|nr:hypothetical protein [Leeuwenhoekiella sp. ZYFB001]